MMVMMVMVVVVMMMVVVVVVMAVMMVVMVVMVVVSKFYVRIPSFRSSQTPRGLSGVCRRQEGKRIRDGIKQLGI
jgi:flagellar basal body-associated protein FliL